LLNVINAHERTVLGLTFIPKTRILVSTGYDRTIRFWDIDTSQELKRLKNAHWGQGKTLAVSPDGRLLNTGWHLWEIESTKPLKLAARGHELEHPKRIGTLWSFFTPDNRYLVISRNFKGIWVWDLAKNTIHEIKGLDQTSVKAITWKDLADTIDLGDAEPTDLLAIATNQYTILFGTPQSLNDSQKWIHKISDNSRSLARSPNGQFLAGFGYNSRINVYDIENDRQFEHDGHAAAVLAVAVSPDGKLIASGGNDQTVRIWNRKSCKQLEVIPVDSFVYSVCFSPDGKLLAIGDNSSNQYLWDISERSLQKYHTSGRITDLAFDPKGELLYSIGFEIHALDLKTRTTKAKISADDSQQGNIALSPDGRFIVGSARSMGATERYKVPPAWTVDGDRFFPVEDLFSEAMGHRYMIHSVAFSPDGSLLAASSHAAIRLWDMKKKKAIGDEFCGHTSSIGDMKFSPNGKWLASASWDGTARIWQIPSGRQAILIDADVDRVSCIDFTPDGQLVTANWDGTVHLWNLSNVEE